jgi:HAD superfamily hydrolase (TIGR01450 family)
MLHPSEGKGLIIDMDGVLWRGRSWLPGVEAFFRQQRRQGRKLMLVTNNATASAESTVTRLGELGVELRPDEVLTSSIAAAHLMKERLPAGANVFPIGEQALYDALRQSGFRLCDTSEGVQAVVVGFDREISWYKLKEAAIAIEHGAWWGPIPTLVFPSPKDWLPVMEPSSACSRSQPASNH